MQLKDGIPRRNELKVCFNSWKIFFIAGEKN